MGSPMLARTGRSNISRFPLFYSVGCIVWCCVALCGTAQLDMRLPKGFEHEDKGGENQTENERPRREIVHFDPPVDGDKGMAAWFGLEDE